MSYRAERQAEPEVERVQSGDDYQRINGDGYQRINDAIYLPLDNGRINRLRNCLIIQGIIIALLFAAVLVLVLSVGVMLGNNRPVNNNSSASHQIIPVETPPTLNCIQDTANCRFSRNVTLKATNSPCTTNSLSTIAKVRNLLYLAWFQCKNVHKSRVLN